MDDAIGQGKAFLLSHDYDYWFNHKPDNFFTRELQYLVKNGYQKFRIGDNEWLLKIGEDILKGDWGLPSTHATSVAFQCRYLRISRTAL